MPYTYEYPHPAVTVDCVVFGYDGQSLQVLLIRRGLDPFKGRWAFPGGFVQMDEGLDDAARRELQEETGQEDIFLEQLYTFGAPGRDPRERVISVAYYALVSLVGREPHASTDAEHAQWFPISRLPDLAFDHSIILDTALQRLRGKVRYEPIGFELLPREFTLTELQRLYERVLGRDLDKRNFRKRILAMDLLRDTGRKEQGVPRRAALLYRFDETRYRELRRGGFGFEI